MAGFQQYCVVSSLLIFLAENDIDHGVRISFRSLAKWWCTHHEADWVALLQKNVNVHGGYVAMQQQNMVCFIEECLFYEVSWGYPGSLRGKELTVVRLPFLPISWYGDKGASNHFFMNFHPVQRAFHPFHWIIISSKYLMAHHTRETWAGKKRYVHVLLTYFGDE